MSIRAEGVSFSYREAEQVLAGVNLAAASGEVTFILGANGSGKTTLLSCLVGVLPPESGRITVDGVPLSTLSPRTRARLIGFVPQIHTPVFAYTVWEVVMMGRAPHLPVLARPGRRDRELTAQALMAVGLWRLRDRPYTEMSGGERRLVLIARGLAQGVRYLLMDEPDAHLDPAFQHRTLTSLGDIAHAERLGILVSSHHPNNALLYADRAVILSGGTIVSDGAPNEAITPSVLRTAYGMPFELLVSGDGRRAVLPITRSSRSV